MYYSVRTCRILLEEQGWDVVAFNTPEGRYYHAEHRELKRSFEGRKTFFKHQAVKELR